MTFVPPIHPGGYIALPVTVDSRSNTKQALLDLMAQFPLWVPREGHLEVAVIEESAQMMAQTAAAAGQVPLAIFTYFGLLVGILPITGEQAIAPVTFTMVDDAGYTIPFGTVVAYPLTGNSQILFTVQSTITIAPGDTTGTGTLICETVGTFANGLAAATCQLNSTDANVSSVVTTGTSVDGVDAETQTAYLNRLSNELQLLAPRPILAADYAAMAANVTGVFRALAIDGLSPGRAVTDGVTTSGSATVTSATIQATTLDIGRVVAGPGVQAGSTILSTGLTSTPTNTVVLSLTATATATGVDLTLGHLTGQERFVTVCGVDENGAALSSGTDDALQAYLASKREVNFMVETIDPTFTEIDITVTCDAVHGANTGTVQSAIVAALNSFLNPATWGGGQLAPPQWSPTAGVVRFLDVANVILLVPGVLYIPSGDLQLCVHGGTLAAVDVTLPGDAPLPALGGTISVTVNPT